MAEKVRRPSNTNELTRREILEGGGIATFASLLSGTTFGQASGAPGEGGSSIYENLGVRPLVNCKGTYTIISGSTSLPQVKQAMDEASRHYVHLDELMEAAGKRLAHLTGAEWGIVTAGCSAAETLATCACIAGADPERLQQLPDLTGLKDEVIVPLYSRNVYDHAIRMLGTRIITVKTTDELEAAFGPRSAMVYILACPDDTGPLGLEPVAALAKKHGVPVLVDAAAENLTPEIHFKRGADLVAYSGGKALRGPQCAGLLLGREDLCKAAWINSAPHHAFGRSMKVGKEEIMGMLAAVEAWYQRDHQAEWKTWESWLSTIAEQVELVAGVKTRILLPDSLSNNAPRLRIEWSAQKIGIAGEEVYQILLDGNPRIILSAGRGRFEDPSEESYVDIMPWMMQPGDDSLVASRLHALLSAPPGLERPSLPTETPPDLAGAWHVEIDFLLGRATHVLLLEQDGHRLEGIHNGTTLSGKLKGTVYGNQVQFRSTQPFEGTRLSFLFSGMATSESMTGRVDLGEYGNAQWTARRCSYPE